MEIPKYLDPEWVRNLKEQCRKPGGARHAINSGVTITLKNPAGGINDYYITRTMYFKGSYEWMISATTPGRREQEVSLALYYDISNDKLSIINSTNGLEQALIEGEYVIVGDINGEWKLQLARMRLALASSLHERLGNDSLYDVPGDIISCIAGKIEAAVGERPLVVERGGDDYEDDDYEDDDYEDAMGGGGYTFKYKKKKKSKKIKRKTKRRKSKRRKSKRRKSKRKKHKTKRRK